MIAGKRKLRLAVLPALLLTTSLLLPCTAMADEETEPVADGNTAVAVLDDNETNDSPSTVNQNDVSDENDSIVGDDGYDTGYVTEPASDNPIDTPSDDDGSGVGGNDAIDQPTTNPDASDIDDDSSHAASGDVEAADQAVAEPGAGTAIEADGATSGSSSEKTSMSLMEDDDSPTPEVDTNKQLLSDGWYYIQSTKDVILTLTGVKSKKNVGVAKDATNKTQLWYLVYNAAKDAYTLKHASTKLYLAIQNSKAGSNVILASGKTNNGLWVITKNTAGGYTLKSFVSSFFLDINNGKNIKAGANVDVAKAKKSGSNIAAHQRWYFLPYNNDYSDSNVAISGGCYTISLTKAKSKTLTVPGGSKADGKQLKSTSYTSSLGQKYLIQKNEDNTYSLQSFTSAKCLSVSGSKIVQSGTDTSSDASKWRIVRQGNGSVAFVNVATGMALSISGASTSDGALAIAATPANKPAQRFTLKKHNVLDNGNYYVRIGTDNAKSPVITVKSGSKSNGAKIIVNKQTYYNDFGTFKVKYLGDGLYSFTNINSGKALRASGNTVTQGSSSGNAAKWTVSLSHDGGVIIKNAATGTVLTSEASSGSTMRAAAEGVSTAQNFYVKKAQVLNSYQKLALAKVIKRDSPRNYYLFADLSVPRMMIWHRANKKSEWTLQDDFIISYGRFEGGKSLTPLLDSAVRSHTRWLDSFGEYRGFWSAPYATHWCSAAWFHSPTHYFYHSSRVIDPRLGLPISSGCIRMDDKYSKWIFYHFKILKGASVTVWVNGKYHW